MDKENKENKGHQEGKKKNYRPWHRRNKKNKKPAVKGDAAPAAKPAEAEAEATLPREEITPVDEQVTPELFLREEEMAPEETFEVVSVRFRPVGKNYSFDPAGQAYRVGENVIVETSQGQEFGTITAANRMVTKKEVVLPLKKVLRRAEEKDVRRNEENKEQELRARRIFQEKNAQHKLDMALSDVEYSFDRSKLIFYFTSEGRVDFREFVKELASIFKTRIELRQIGVRDEAKQLGGLGICGRPLCCSSFLDDFQQVSIKMAKEQNLSLNPTKISGTCGRLMCCLRYENDVYVEAAKHCPKVDCPVQTPQGKGVVVETNVLCKRCKVKLDADGETVVTFSAQELKPLPKTKRPQNQGGGGEKSNS